MTWNQQKNKPARDNFWIGLVPALVLPVVILLALIMQNTERDVFYILGKLPIILRNTGISRLMVAVLPNLVLMFVFYMLKKDRAISGAFVGCIPYFILMFWVF
ncbi:MAG: hypothetical protein LBR81_09385 [Prevotellaceae bacterium]|jgi:hypothetical protein|nr:hypothetical protein [Prevotellaceae bacterium]